MIWVIGKGGVLGKMNAVEKLGSYITRGVYTVSGPFHPFGGAVDIVVVQQQDGSFKSSPWYVRFGKFQGVLKSKEKIVNISVNGIEAGFHMYLNHKGEAFFVRESDTEEGDFVASPSTSGDETDGKMQNGRFKKIQSCNFDGSQSESVGEMDLRNGKSLTHTRSRRSTMIGRMFGRRSMKEGDKDGSVKRANSLECAEIAAELMEMKWSTNLPASARRADNYRERPSKSDASAVNPIDGFKRSLVNGNYIQEITSHEEVVGTYTLETGNIANRVTMSNKTDVQLEGPISGDGTINVQNVGSAALSRDTVQTLNESYGSSTDDVIAFESGTKDFASFSYSELLENSIAKFEDPAHQTPDIVDVSSTEVLHFDNISGDLHNTGELISEVRSQLETDALRAKEDPNRCHNQYVELCEVQNSSTPQDSLTDHPRNVAFENSVTNGSSPLMVTSGHISPDLCLVSSKSQAISTDCVTVELAQDGETSSAQSSVQNQPQMEEGGSTQPTQTLMPRSIQNLSSTDKEESYRILCFPGSHNSSSQVEEVQNLEKGVGVASQSTEVVQLSIPFSEGLGDDHFPFIETDSFGVKEVGPRLSTSGTASETEDHPSLSSEGDVDELERKDHDRSADGLLEVLRSHSIPIDIPQSTAYSRGAELLAISLPNIRSDIHDLEGSSLLHPLSCSLDSKSEKYDLDVGEHSSSKVVAGSPCDEVQGQPKCEVVAAAVDDEHEEERKGTQIDPDIELSLCKHLLSEGMGADAARQAFDAEKEHVFEPQLTIPVDRAEKNFEGDASLAIVRSGGSWSLWPFGLKKSRTIDTVRSAREGADGMASGPASKSTKAMTRENDMQRAKDKKKAALTPTSEELASLNLKEGQNVVTFSFSTSMLGQQQVDARIYLWKWNTRIVISDVDGTITKSDVLGQFMPLVGVDWSQTGVTHLFSAIKENGYQLLFLSARAISQAHLTRQFLFNLKQDGKALPNGPVVISPDGLFPSLYREVIRRAPHEFKIDCLETIKALFPPDSNPFYAGFGNRDTDEISYLKVGIPINKIFIINPRGEVAVNRRVDTRSYTSLHALVNGMFPPMSSAEQEDYNSWNYWKLPLPEVDL